MQQLNRIYILETIAYIGKKRIYNLQVYLLNSIVLEITDILVHPEILLDIRNIHRLTYRTSKSIFYKAITRPPSIPKRWYMEGGIIQPFILLMLNSPLCFCILMFYFSASTRVSAFKSRILFAVSCTNNPFSVTLIAVYGRTVTVDFACTSRLSLKRAR